LGSATDIFCFEIPVAIIPPTKLRAILPPPINAILELLIGFKDGSYRVTVVAMGC